MTFSIAKNWCKNKSLSVVTIAYQWHDSYYSVYLIMRSYERVIMWITYSISKLNVEEINRKIMLNSISLSLLAPQFYISCIIKILSDMIVIRIDKRESKYILPIYFKLYGFLLKNLKLLQGINRFCNRCVCKLLTSYYGTENCWNYVAVIYRI